MFNNDLFNKIDKCTCVCNNKIKIYKYTNTYI